MGWDTSYFLHELLSRNWPQLHVHTACSQSPHPNSIIKLHPTVSFSTICGSQTYKELVTTIPRDTSPAGKETESDINSFSCCLVHKPWRAQYCTHIPPGSKGYLYLSSPLSLQLNTSLFSPSRATNTEKQSSFGRNKMLRKIIHFGSSTMSSRPLAPHPLPLLQLLPIFLSFFLLQGLLKLQAGLVLRKRHKRNHQLSCFPDYISTLRLWTDLRMPLTNTVITGPISIHTKCHALIPHSSLPLPLLYCQGTYTDKRHFI